MTHQCESNSILFCNTKVETVENEAQKNVLQIDEKIINL